MIYSIEDSVLSSIADAIRNKAGTSDVFEVTDFASAIDSIPSGGGDEDWINYVEGNTTTVSGSASKIRSGAFALTNIIEANFPSCTSIGTSAFYMCSNLLNISASKCTYIGSLAFYNCFDLSEAVFPLVDISTTTDCRYMFASCSNLTTAIFPICKNIASYMFQQCYNLTTVSFPECSAIGTDAFYNCYNNLTTASFPKCSMVGSSAFYNCSNLTTISFPKCTNIRMSAFYKCSKLSIAIFPMCKAIGQMTFYSCSKIESLYINTSNCTLSNKNAFQYTPMSDSSYLGYFGSIYVPSEYVETYKSATNWVAYADRITAIPESMITE